MATLTVKSKTKSLSDYKALADVALQQLNTAYEQLGRILLDAERDLGKEYQNLVLHMKHQGLMQCRFKQPAWLRKKSLNRN